MILFHITRIHFELLCTQMNEENMKKTIIFLIDTFLIPQISLIKGQKHKCMQLHTVVFKSHIHLITCEGGLKDF